MKFVSVIQPFATLLALGIKHIENRTYPTRHRGPIAIHASKRQDDEMWDAARRLCKRAGIRFPTDIEFHYGGIVGVASLAGVLYLEDGVIMGTPRGLDVSWLSFWNQAAYGWVMAENQVIEFIPMRGALGVRDLPPEINLPIK